MKRNVLTIGILLATALVITGCGPGDTGTLKGNVNLVGGGEAGPSPAEYAARQIIIKEGNGLAEVMRADLDPEGNFSVILLEGVYMIDITHDGPEGTSGLPKQIQIIPGEIAELNVDVQIGGG